MRWSFGLVVNIFAISIEIESPEFSKDQLSYLINQNQEAIKASTICTSSGTSTPIPAVLTLAK